MADPQRFGIHRHDEQPMIKFRCVDCGELYSTPEAAQAHANANIANSPDHAAFYICPPADESGK